MFNTIVFDFDGTLVDSFYMILNFLNDNADKYGYSRVEDLSKIRHKNAKKIIKEDFKVPWYKVPYFAWKFGPIVRKKVREEANFVEGMRDALYRISKDYSVGILTANPRENVEYVLRRENIDCVDFIETAKKIFGKHSAIKKTLKKRNIANYEFLYVGDELRDIECCRKAQVPIASACWGYNTREALQKADPDCLVKTPKDLVDLLCR